MLQAARALPYREGVSVRSCRCPPRYLASHICGNNGTNAHTLLSLPLHKSHLPTCWEIQGKAWLLPSWPCGTGETNANENIREGTQADLEIGDIQAQEIHLSQKEFQTWTNAAHSSHLCTITRLLGHAPQCSALLRSRTAWAVSPRTTCVSKRPLEFCSSPSPAFCHLGYAKLLLATWRSESTKLSNS